jgi:hypothetical protein
VAAAAAMAKILPAPIDYFLVQADLTVVVPGPLQRELADELAAVATVESAGAAMVYRVGEQSIRHALDTYCADGDIVLFIDADTYPIADLTVLYNECARIGGIMAFAATAGHQPFRNREWNKRDCMIQMGMDEERYLEAPTAVARFMLFQKGAPLVDTFLAEWQYYCLDPVCQTFEPSTMAQEHPGFREHRTEQAIYTNLCHKYGLKLYREACAFGNEHQQDWELYPQLFIQQDPARPKSLQGSRYRNV